jgi:hypothetical protein
VLTFDRQLKAPRTIAGVPYSQDQPDAAQPADRLWQLVLALAAEDQAERMHDRAVHLIASSGAAVPARAALAPLTVSAPAACDRTQQLHVGLCRSSSAPILPAHATSCSSTVSSVMCSSLTDVRPPCCRPMSPGRLAGASAKSAVAGHARQPSAVHGEYRRPDRLGSPDGRVITVRWLPASTTWRPRRAPLIAALA